MGATGGIFQVTGNIILIFFEIIKKMFGHEICMGFKYVTRIEYTTNKCICIKQTLLFNKITYDWSKMDFFKEIFGIIQSITYSCPRLGKNVQ